MTIWWLAGSSEPMSPSWSAWRVSSALLCLAAAISAVEIVQSIQWRACVRAWRPMIMSLADEHLSAPRVPRPSHTRPPTTTTTNQCSALSDSLRHNAYTHTHTIAVRPSHWVGRRRYDPSPRTRPHYVYGFRPFIRLPLISPSGAVNKCKSNCNKSSARRPPVTDVTSKGKLPGTVSNIYETFSYSKVKLRRLRRCAR